MNSLEVLHKILNKKKQKESIEVSALVSLCHKFLDQKPLFILLNQYPSDIFNIEFWNKAKQYKDEFKEISDSFYSEKDLDAEFAKPKRHWLCQSKAERLEKQAKYLELFNKKNK